MDDFATLMDEAEDDEIPARTPAPAGEGKPGKRAGKRAGRRGQPTDGSRPARGGSSAIVLMLGLLLCVALVLGLALLLRSNISRLQALFSRPEPAPTQVFGPTLPDGSGLAALPATATPLPLETWATATPTPLPTLEPLEVAVSGPSYYTDGRPYLAEYAVGLVRGGQVSVAVSCMGCLWPAAGAPVLALDVPGAQVTFRAGVLPGQTARFNLAVNGMACTDWQLAPAGADETFRAACVPLTD